MRKILCVIVLVLALGGTAFSASKAELRRMSDFLSSFTEVGLFNFDMKANFDDDEEEEGEPKVHLGMPENVSTLVNFGIMHTLIHGRNRVKECRDPDCESGPLKLEAKYVAEAVRKYFGVDLAKKKLLKIDEDPSVVFTYDGKFFHFSEDSFREPGEDKVYYADVQGVTQRAGGNLMFAGDIYNSRQITDRPGIFAATVKPSGKSWIIVDMTTDWVTNAGRD